MDSVFVFDYIRVHFQCLTHQKLLSDMCLQVFESEIVHHVSMICVTLLTSLYNGKPYVLKGKWVCSVVVVDTRFRWLEKNPYPLNKS